MKKSYFILKLFLLVSSIVISQNQNSNWVVGFAGNCFNVNYNTTPLVLDPLQLPSQAPFNDADFLEGVASVSDQNGNLLLFSDGVRLWRHNFDGTNTLLTDQLRGNYSSAQNVIFIPRPGNPNRYFVVTISGATSPVFGSAGGRGLYFSEVDINTGMVGVLNTPLRTNPDLTNNLLTSLPINEGFSNISEAITSTGHSNGTDYWLVAQIENANFGVVVSYRIDCNGFPSDRRPNNQTFFTSGAMSHMLKISQSEISLNTSRIALSNVGPTGTFIGTFNRSNGILNMSTNNFIIPGEIKYGIEFSPNSNLLYLTGHGLTCFNLNSNTIVYDTIDFGGETGLQLAIDGNIYSASGFAINDPNTASINNITNGIQLTQFAGMGLPQWVHWQVNTNSVINATADNFIISSGSTSSSPIYINDTNNGIPITSLTGYTISVVGAVNGISINPNGFVVVAPGIPCGTYEIRYKICTTNTCPTCSNDCIVTVNVEQPNTVVAFNDDFEITCSSMFVNVNLRGPNPIGIDNINGNAVPFNATAQFVYTGATNITGTYPQLGDISMSPNGMLLIQPETSPSIPGQSYFFQYKIIYTVGGCTYESNVATVTIKVIPPPIAILETDKEVFCVIDGSVSELSVLNNDTFNGSPATIDNVTIEQISTNNPNVQIDITNGLITVATGTPPGTYFIEYIICQKCVVGNCSDIERIAVSVKGLIAIDDEFIGSATQINGVKNVIMNDVISCITNYSINIITPNPPFTINPTTGIISIPEDLPPGNYSIMYQICEVANPTYCDTASVSITIKFRANNTIKTVNSFNTTSNFNTLKYVISGDFTDFNNVSKNKLALLNNDLTIDTSFGNSIGFGPSGSQSRINTVHVVTNDGIYVGGSFTNFNNNPRNNFVKLNFDGTINVNFNYNFNAPSEVYEIKRLGSSIYVACADNVSSSRKGIARLNAAGVVNSNVNSGSGTNGSVNAMGIINNNTNIIFAGRFTTYNNSVTNNIAMINLLGIMQPFNQNGSGFGFPADSGKSINKIYVDNVTNKIYVVGDFSTYNGSIARNIVRINSTGSIDTDFNANITLKGANGEIKDIIPTTDCSGCFYISGKFTEYNGQQLGANSNLIRIFSTGLRDESFNQTTSNSFSNPFVSLSTIEVNALSQVSNLLAAVGNFKSYNSSLENVNGLVRINPITGAQQKQLETSIENNSDLSIYPNPSNGNFSIKFNEVLKTETSISVYNILGQKVIENSITDVEIYDLNLFNYPSGSYIIKISNDEKTTTKTIIKE